MLKIEKTEVLGWEAALRGMRNPKNSWDRSDSYKISEAEYVIGDNDHELMMNLAKGGSVHAKYRRMIIVTVDITAPLYWWKEFDTYKVGTVANSCSTMHKIHARDLTLEDFSHEHLDACGLAVLDTTIRNLNFNRNAYLKTKDQTYWQRMIQMLPSSYNQKRTILMNYEVLVGMFRDRKSHKLDEWHTLCDWIRQLPCSEIITGDVAE
jgi:hypothetical protein